VYTGGISHFIFHPQLKTAQTGNFKKYNAVLNNSPTYTDPVTPEKDAHSGAKKRAYL